MSAQDFGHKLREYRRATTDPQRGGALTQARFVECLAHEANAPIFPPKQVSYWENGHQTIRHDQRDVLVGIIYVLHRYGALLTLEEANGLLYTGGYRDLDAAEIQRVNPEWAQRGGIVRPPGRVPPGLAMASYLPAPTRLLQQLDDMFDWSEADDHVRGSWRGRVIHLLNTAQLKLDPLGFIKGFLWLALWAGAACLILPLWSWPLNDPGKRGQAALTYGLASLLVPMAVAALTTADRQTLFQLDKPGQRRTLWGLKLAGAYVGFNSILPLGLVPVMLVFYAWGSALPVWLLALFVGLALLWGSVAAGRIPADRFKMYQPLLRFHPADWLFLGTFSLFGLGFAAFVYFLYTSFLGLWPTGVAIPLILLGVAIWQAREGQSWPDWLLVLILGLVLPGLILIPYLWPYFDSPLTWTRDEWGATLLAGSYIGSLGMLLVTLRLRRPWIVTLRGLLGLLLGLGVINVVALTGNRQLTLGLAAAMGLLLILGRRRLHPYLWVHISLPLLLTTIGASFWLALDERVTGWLNGLGFAVLAGLLILWAYGRRPPGGARDETPEEVEEPDAEGSD